MYDQNDANEPTSFTKRVGNDVTHAYAISERKLIHSENLTFSAFAL